MKRFDFLRNLGMMALFLMFNLTVFAANPGENLVYNTQKVNGLVLSEVIYKKNDNLLTHYLKHNYKYDAEKRRTQDEQLKWNGVARTWEPDVLIRYTYENKSVTTEYYRWDNRKHEYVLAPELTVTMDY